MGNAAVIAERTGVSVISDFRSRDVAAGGQGAPLVTIADARLFSSPDKWRATLNLGGIANVQLLPPGVAVESATSDAGLGGVRAFDTGPGVGILDRMVRLLFPDLPYDIGGALARGGIPMPDIVDEFLQTAYFAEAPPKSTGRELFSPAYANVMIDYCRHKHPDCTPEDIIASATLYTARSVALAFEKFIPEPVEEILVSGGGAKNPALFDAIREEVTQAARRTKSRVPSIVPFDDFYFDGEAKECVAFAFLGWLHLQGRAGNVPGATGARGPRILGSFTPA
jgi:anhydro-N-acetylmuramic acid kinase